MLGKLKSFRRLRGWLYLLLTCSLIGLMVAWVYHSNHFPIKQVKIEGSLAHTDSKALQKIAQQYVRGNIFQADLNGAQQAFEQLPWIESADVRRRLPDAVEIKLVEHEALAKWKDGRLVSSKGQLFKAASEDKLPAFEGEQGTEKMMAEHYQLFSQQLQPLALRIEKLHYTPRSAWEVVLDNRVSVRLGRENERERLSRFVEVWPGVLKPLQSQLSYVDMRYKDGFSIRQRNDAAESDAQVRPSETKTAQQ